MFFTSGLSYVLFLIIYILDIKQLWDGWPFEYLGLNSIIIYSGSEVKFKIRYFNFFFLLVFPIMNLMESKCSLIYLEYFVG
jgi:hypothetical protein